MGEAVKAMVKMVSLCEWAKALCHIYEVEDRGM